LEKGSVLRWLIALLLLLLPVACGGSSEETAPAANLPGEGSTKQIVYNQWLDFHRTQTMTDPEVVGYACDPNYWNVLAEDVPEEGDPLLFKIALIDACHEAGELTELDVWSPYYANAPEP
jgi:hypothetical protein